MSYCPVVTAHAGAPTPSMLTIASVPRLSKRGERTITFRTSLPDLHPRVQGVLETEIEKISADLSHDSLAKNLASILTSVSPAHGRGAGGEREGE